MSDEQQLEQAVTTDSTDNAAEKKPAETKSKKPPKQAKVGLLWFFVLITLLVSGAAGYGVYWLSKQTDQAAVSQSDLLEQSQTAIIDLRGDLSGVEEVIQQQAQSNEITANAADQKIDLLAKSIEKQARHIKELSASNRDQWLLAEVEYLLRLANQRILMSQDSAGALSMLDSADRILQGIDDVSLHAVRKSIADDLASLRGVEQVDIDGTYLTLAALATQVETLELYDIPEFDMTAADSEIGALEPAPQQSLSEKLSNALEAVSAALQKVFIIRRNNETVEAMLAPQDEMYLRQNLRLMIEQAQLALLSGKPAVYQKSLEKTQRWIAQYYLMDNKGTQAALQSLSDLAAININPGLPDISGSFRALKKYQKGQMNSRPGLDYQPAQPSSTPEPDVKETAPVAEAQSTEQESVPEPPSDTGSNEEPSVTTEGDTEDTTEPELEMVPAEAANEAADAAQPE